MPISKNVAAPNALLFLSDLNGGTAPNEMEGKLIVSTSTCIAIGCMSDFNGETKITVGRAQDVDISQVPAFDGEVDTPSHTVALKTIDGAQVLEAPVRQSRTRVLIWVNHPSEPDKIVIGLD